mmetsp:Transcript_15665/g.33839  ORF Transcript_15665/g.33839 Transcript_15665/m.33839 type:complete len:232 (-) Transcript_15665:1788-2483(-)
MCEFSSLVVILIVLGRVNLFLRQEAHSTRSIFPIHSFHLDFPHTLGLALSAAIIHAYRIIPILLATTLILLLLLLLFLIHVVLARILIVIIVIVLLLFALILSIKVLHTLRAFHLWQHLHSHALRHITPNIRLAHRNHTQIIPPFLRRLKPKRRLKHIPPPASILIHLHLRIRRHHSLHPNHHVPLLIRQYQPPHLILMQRQPPTTRRQPLRSQHQRLVAFFRRRRRCCCC